MMRLFTTVLTLGSLLTAGAAEAFTYWNDVRTSALLPGDLVTIRVENPSGGGAVNSILYSQSGVQEAPVIPVNDGPSTLEATVPGPVSATHYYGFRLVQGTDLDLLPVRIADGVSPQPDDLTQLAQDPIGDEIIGRVHLDLTECRISRDGTRLYAALTNAGGGFPVNDGLTFFSYLLGITDPAATAPDTVLAMIQTVTAFGIIEPGLYQVNGTGVNDLVKIGEITATEFPAQNTLILSCELADLEANAYFQSWYDPVDPRIGVAAFTQRITLLGGVVEADATSGGTWHLREVSVDPGPNQLPQLANLMVPLPGAGGFVSVEYSDADGHCPVIAEAVFDGIDTYLLRPQVLDYGASVEYRSDTDIPPLLGGGWSQAVVRFSDDTVAIVELNQSVVGVEESRLGLPVRAAPNPFSSRTLISFSLDRSQPAQLEIYDLAGRRVATLADGVLSEGTHTYSWRGRDARERAVSAGVYFYRLRTVDRETVGRLIRMR